MFNPICHVEDGTWCTRQILQNVTKNYQHYKLEILSDFFKFYVVTYEKNNLRLEILATKNFCGIYCHDGSLKKNWISRNLISLLTSIFCTYSLKITVRYFIFADYVVNCNNKFPEQFLSAKISDLNPIQSGGKLPPILLGIFL